jgi:hypothetical protein
MPSPIKGRRPRRPRLLREPRAEGHRSSLQDNGIRRPRTGVVPPTRPPWWRRGKPLAAAVAGVIGTFSAGLAIWAWIGETFEAPLLVTAEHQSNGTCGPGWVIPHPVEALGPVPPGYDPDDPNARQEWVDSHGGVDADHTTAVVTVQGTRAQAVILTGLRVDVVRREPPMSGINLFEGCGDLFAARFFEVALDQDPPEVGPSVDLRNQGGGDIEVDPIDFPYTVTDSDPELFSIIAWTEDCYCEWTATLEWRVGEREGESLILDEGKPFRVSASTNAPGYGNYAGGTLEPLG